MKNSFIKSISSTLAIIMVCLFFNGSISAQTLPITQTTPGNYSFVATAPYIVNIEAWGAGGKGGNVSGNPVGNAGGGGGGAYSKTTNVTLIVGHTYQYMVGSGTTGADFSSFEDVTAAIVYTKANGGQNGFSNGIAGSGGGAATGIGNIKYDGGNGAAASSQLNTGNGGGGGSSAGTGSVGNNAVGSTGGIAPVGGAKGGDGGTGGAGVNDAGDSGDVPGGGGGGAHKGATGAATINGGNGGNGKVFIELACVPPTVTCPSNVTVNTDLGVCTAAVSYSVTSTGFPSPTFTYLLAGTTTGSGAGTGSGLNYNKGLTSVTVTATNACGNSSCTFTIIVEDNEPPVIDPQAADITVECDGAGNAADLTAWLSANGGAHATDNCGIVTWSNDYSSLSDDCGATGSATVTFTASDPDGNTSQTTATFTIEDTTPPDAVCQDITIEWDEIATAEIDASDIDGGSTDVCSGTNVTIAADTTTFDCNDLGDNVVTLTVTDDCGNTSTCTAIVTVVIPVEWQCHNGEKVTICHHDHGDPVCKNICINTISVCDHVLSHEGDHLGSCTEEDGCRIEESFSLAVDPEATSAKVVADVNKDAQVNVVEGDAYNSLSVNEPAHVVPNPFDQLAVIHFGLNAPAQVSLRIYNNMGQEITTLFEGTLNAGKHSFTFNGADYPTGIYSYTLTTGRQVQSERMMLVR